MSELKESFGIVAIIDALGVSSYSLEESKEFLEIKKKLLKQIHLSTEIKKIAVSDSTLREIMKPKTFTFGDTIIFIWELDIMPADKGFATIIAAEWLRQFLFLGISNQLFFRGAISIGNFVHDNNTTVIGPAVADAASWYEQAEWFGIVCTPSFNYYLDAFSEATKKIENIQMYKYYEKFDVPCKTGVYNLYSISWPFELFTDSKELAHFVFNSLLSPNEKFTKNKILITKGSELKYKNAENFFNYYSNKYSNNLPDKKPPYPLKVQMELIKNALIKNKE